MRSYGPFDSFVSGIEVVNKLLDLKVVCYGPTTPDAILSEIWIGSMNYRKDTPKLSYQTIYNRYKYNPIIKWKDSFFKQAKKVGVVLP
jgi:hypothetical protein